MVNFNELSAMTTMRRILLLRTIAIIIQVLAVVGLFSLMKQNIVVEPLLKVIFVEVIFHLVSLWFYRSRSSGVVEVTFQLVADIIFLTLLMSLSGGATNAFVSLLLLPIVIGAVSLPTKLLTLVSFFAVAAYSALLLSLPASDHHMDMSNHFIGMWVNFLLSVIVVTLVVGTMSKMITTRERAIAKQREDQLKSEQLISLGVASAQVTHQLATPLANLQLLFEEINEDYPNNEAVLAMETPLNICRSELNHFRELATSIRENHTVNISPKTLLDNLKLVVNLQHPNIQISIIRDANTTSFELIKSDAMLIPALCNLIQNAIDANVETQSNTVELALDVDSKFLTLSIRDFGHGIEHSKVNLGDKLVLSKDGLGMALMLSSSSIERLGGILTLHNHFKQGAVATIKFPLVLPNQGV